MSNFSFLQSEWPAIYEAATRAEEAVESDHRTACFYARRALELAVAWLYKHDSTLKLPYQDHLKAFPLVLPPLHLQREFARRVQAVEKLKTAQHASLAEMDALFATLQHRAFRGEL